MRPLAERAGLERRRPRLGHPRRRQREHGQRGARAHRRARPGPPPLRAAVRPAARAPCMPATSQEAGHQPADRAARRRRRLGARHADGAGARRPRGDGAREMDQVVWPDLEATFARLEADARAVLAATLPDGAAPAITRLADIRYVGQASELVVPLPAGPYTAASRGALMQAFEASYVAAFTRTPPTTQVEIINVRVSASIDIGTALADWAAVAAGRSGAALPMQREGPPRQRRGPTPSRARAPSTSPSSAISPHHRLRPLRASSPARPSMARPSRAARIPPLSSAPAAASRSPPAATSS